MRLRSSTPVFLVSDVAATLSWYRTALRFEGAAFPEQPPHAFGILRRDEVQIFLQQLTGYVKPDLYAQREGGVWHVYITVTGVEELYGEVAKQPEVKMIYGLCQQPYGQLEFAIEDVNGYVVVFAQQTETRTE